MRNDHGATHTIDPPAETPRTLLRPPARPTISAREALSRYALLGIWGLMAAFFWLQMPNLFGTSASVSSIFGSQQVQVFLGLAVLVTAVAGELDLSVASIMGLTATAIPVLVSEHGVPILWACVISLVASLLLGAINAFFVVVMELSALVVTLGMATLLIGVAQAISKSQIVTVRNDALTNLAAADLLGLPISFFYGVALALVITYVLAWTPLGRSIVFVGANREVARLSGIRVSRLRYGSYIVGAMLASVAGILLVGTIGGFDSSTSMTFLLPALAAVFLGTAVIQPGEFNAIGTMVAIYFLQTGIFGLQLMGYSGWIQNVFYGAGLVAALALSRIVRNRTMRA